MNAYTPEGLLVLLAGGTGIVLLWVGVALGAGLGLYFIFTGIRAGVRMFRGVADVAGPVGYADFGGPVGMNPDPTEYTDDEAQYVADMHAGWGPDDQHSGWIDTSGFDMGMDAPDVGVRPGK